jgi:holo-[acyl-carrier protein] synthase
MTQFGIGTDLVEVQRFENLNDRAFFAFLKKNFTQNELDYCLSKEAPAPHLASRFAGKEAVIKALYSINITDIFYPSIEILNDDYGVPYVRINIDKTDNLCIKISLSHSYEFALAFCIIVREI